MLRSAPPRSLIGSSAALTKHRYTTKRWASARRMQFGPWCKLALIYRWKSDRRASKSTSGRLTGALVSARSTMTSSSWVPSEACRRGLAWSAQTAIPASEGQALPAKEAPTTRAPSSGFKIATTCSFAESRTSPPRPQCSPSPGWPRFRRLRGSRQPHRSPLSLHCSQA